MSESHMQAKPSNSAIKNAPVGRWTEQKHAVIYVGR